MLFNVPGLVMNWLKKLFVDDWGMGGPHDKLRFLEKMNIFFHVSQAFFDQKKRSNFCTFVRFYVFCSLLHQPSLEKQISYHKKTDNDKSMPVFFKENFLLPQYTKNYN